MTVLVDGIFPNCPPLTSDLVGQVGAFYQWLLDAPTAPQEDSGLETILIAAWQDRNPVDIETAVSAANMSAFLATQSTAQQGIWHEQWMPEMVSMLRIQPGGVAQWAVSAYDAAHEPLVPGSRPLTREVSDVLFEMLVFASSDPFVGPALDPNSNAKEDFAAKFAAHWNNIPDQLKAWYSQLPLQWAMLRNEWPMLRETDRLLRHTHWQSALQPLLQSSPATPTHTSEAPLQREPRAPLPSASGGRGSFQNDGSRSPIMSPTDLQKDLWDRKAPSRDWNIPTVVSLPNGGIEYRYPHA